MKRFIEIVKRLFRKKQLFIMDMKDLKELISESNITCESCHKPIANLEDISKIYIKDKQLHIYCTSCRG